MFKPPKGQEHMADAYDAMWRLSRAHKRGTGCHLTAEMVANLAITHFGQLWADDETDTKGPEKSRD